MNGRGKGGKEKGKGLNKCHDLLASLRCTLYSTWPIKNKIDKWKIRFNGINKTKWFEYALILLDLKWIGFKSILLRGHSLKRIFRLVYYVSLISIMTGVINRLRDLRKNVPLWSYRYKVSDWSFDTLELIWCTWYSKIAPKKIKVNLHSIYSTV